MSRAFRPKPAALAVGETLPAACDAHDVAHAFGVSLNTVYDWKRDGKLRKFELRQPMGSKHWSGAKLQEFLVDANRSMALLQKVG